MLLSTDNVEHRKRTVGAVSTSQVSVEVRNDFTSIKAIFSKPGDIGSRNCQSRGSTRGLVNRRTKDWRPQTVLSIKIRRFA
jgi:hypothetical protein